MNPDLILIPIEPLEERYSSQWLEWFTDSMNKMNLNYLIIGDLTERKISVGQFLDVIETNKYKLNQMIELIDFVTSTKFNGTILFMDMWFPALEALAYVRDNLKLNFRIKGILHAGTWDHWDFLSQNGCNRWAKDIEKGWMSIADEILVSTNFHMDMITSYTETKTKITIVEFPVYNTKTVCEDKKNIVVFPHRLAPEKQPEGFLSLEREYRRRYPEHDVTFIRSKDVCKTKIDYYNLLMESKVAVSTAFQETFGIAMLESYNCGCFPVVPDRLSYQETFANIRRYNSLSQAVDLIHYGLNKYTVQYNGWTQSADSIIKAAIR